MKDFRSLKVWRKAHRLTLQVYRVTAAFPREERYGMTGQIRRSSCSISASLAEGCGRSGDGDLARFCSIALGSASELESLLLLARDLKLLRRSDWQSLMRETTEVKKMLAGLLQRLKAER